MSAAAKRAKEPASWPNEASKTLVRVVEEWDDGLCAAPILEVVIPGPPLPKGRPRAAIVRSKGKATVRMYTPAETERYEAHVRNLLTLACAQQDWPLGGWRSSSVRYALHAEFVIERDVEDADNLVKAQLDAANKVLFPDDRRVCLMLVARRVAADGEVPRAKLRVWALGPTTEAP